MFGAGAYISDLFRTMNLTRFFDIAVVTLIFTALT